MANGMSNDDANAVARIGSEILEYGRRIEQQRHLIALLRP